MITMRKMRPVAAVIVLAATLLTACGDDAPKPLRSTASIQITSPKQGAIVDGDSIPVTIELTDGRIAERASNDPADNKPDVGHMHVILDGKTVSLLEGLSFDLVDVLESSQQPPIAKGRHVLQAEFATVSHGFFSPRVLSAVTFTVR